MAANTGSRGEIYLVQKTQSVRLNLSIYTYGLAHDGNLIMQAFPRGSHMICRIPVSDRFAACEMVCALCRSDIELVQCLDFGPAAFRGDVCLLIEKLVAAAKAFPLLYVHNTGEELRSPFFVDQEIGLVVSSPGYYSEGYSDYGAESSASAWESDSDSQSRSHLPADGDRSCEAGH